MAIEQRMYNTDFGITPVSLWVNRKQPAMRRQTHWKAFHEPGRSYRGAAFCSRLKLQVLEFEDSEYVQLNLMGTRVRALRLLLTELWSNPLSGVK
jgi:hypothetical protein